MKFLSTHPGHKLKVWDIQDVQAHGRLPLSLSLAGLPCVCGVGAGLSDDPCCLQLEMGGLLQGASLILALTCLSLTAVVQDATHSFRKLWLISTIN